MRNIYFISSILLILLISCQSDENRENSLTPFDLLDPIERGIDFKNELNYTDNQNIIDYLYYYNGGGVAIGDINNDGLEDIVLTANQQADRLYLNKGDLRFEDISVAAGISQLNNWSSGVVIDDVNGDGWNDIYICKVALVSDIPTHNELYINQKDGTFIESSKEYGLDFSGYSTQVSFFDYDRDGDLDMYLLNHSVHSTRSYGSTKKRNEPDLLSGDKLFQNRLDESEQQFIEVTQDAGIYSSALGYGLGLVTSDINDDGWVDIYVGNDFHENDYFYINNGDGTFTESIEQYFTHNSQFTMGVDAADINQDGTIDLFTTDMMPFEAEILMKSGGNDTEQIKKIKDDFGFLRQYSRNMLQINRDNKVFSEQGNMTNTFASDWSWSVLLQDFDNSGTTDIFISNGIYKRPNDLDYINYINTPANRQQEEESDDEYNRRLMDQMPTLKVNNLYFSQEDNLKFSSIEVSKIGTPTYSNGTAYADLDRDGDLDIIANNVNENITIMEGSGKGHFISFDVNGSKNAKIEIHYNGLRQTKEYTTTRGYQSSCSHYVHFGLGSEVVILDSVAITWPDQTIQMMYDLPIDQYHEVVRNSEIQKVIATKQSNSALRILPIRHKENSFDDFDNAPLSILRMSRRGPASVYADFDQDGIKDLFVGGSKNQEAQYYRGTNDLTFQKINIPAFKSDGYHEDVDAAFLDFDQDGFLDLYVVSGGNEQNELSKGLQDRLYINNQKGGFYKLDISLPHTNGSSISVADYDDDGYPDMFVGASNIPGVSGLSPMSFVIKNVNAQRLEIVFKDRMGQVTDSKWVDLDGDGSTELLVVGHWMPLRVFGMDENGEFGELTHQYQIPEVKGLYECVEVADINEDGQADFILGNIGLNTSLSFSDHDKIEMYTGDFDNNSYLESIIFHSYFGIPVPFANKMTIQSQVPSIKKSINTYKDFSAIRNITDLVGELDLIKQTKSIDQLASIMVLSSETGYKVVTLPRQSQSSSINDFYWDEQGKNLYYVGNDQSSSHSLGQNLSNPGGVLSRYDHEQGQFLRHDFINLPINTVAKKIIRVSDDTMLIINNDDLQYILSL